MEFLRKLQSQPPHIRKLIFWAIIIVLAVVMGFWWFKSTQQRLSNFQEEEFIRNMQFPEIKFPAIEFPEPEMEEGIQNYGQDSATTTE